MSSLRPCPTCSRHVRLSERSCPFCDCALELSNVVLAARPSAGGARLKRAALFAVSASAIATAACGGEDDDSNSDVMQQAEGADTSGTSTNAGTGESGGAGGAGGSMDPLPGGGDEPSPQPVYGAPVAPEDLPPGFGGAGGAGNVDQPGPGGEDEGMGGTGGAFVPMNDEERGQGGNGGISVQPVYGAPVSIETDTEE